MKTNLKEINSYTRQLDVTIAWEMIQEEYNKEFHRARSSFSIPGFRKGKVPEKIVKQQLGPSIEAHFAEHSLNTYYRKALEELELSPINQAQINKVDFREGNDLSFTAEFEVEPEIKLPKYQRKFKIQETKYLLEEEDINQELKRFQEKHATIKTIDSGAKSGHFVKADFHALNNSGSPNDGGKIENQYIHLGFGLFKDDVEAKFIGVKDGDVIAVSLPTKDTPVTYEVTVKRVEEQILPELDDEFVKTLNEDTPTLKDLKTQIKEQIQVSLDKEFNEAVRRGVINYFVENSTIEAPTSMVANYLDHIREDMKSRNQPVEEENLEENYKSHAEWNIKWYLLKNRIIENELLDVSDEELQSKIDDIIARGNDNSNKIKSFYRQSKNKQRLYDELLNDKLFEKLNEYAKIKVIEKSTNELRKQQAAK